MGLHLVLRGYKGLESLTRGCGGYRKLQGFKNCPGGLQEVTRGYTRLHGVTWGYRGLH